MGILIEKMKKTPMGGTWIKNRRVNDVTKIRVLCLKSQ
jgi:hypothetical protein